MELATEITQNLTTLVASLKNLLKFAGGMKHLTYLIAAVDVLKYAVSFALQLGKLDLSSEDGNQLVFKNDPKHHMVFQLASFYSSYVKEIEVMKEYAADNASLVPTAEDATDGEQQAQPDLLTLMAKTHSQLDGMMRPVSLSDAVRRQTAQYDLTLQSMQPAMAKVAGHFFQGAENDWKDPSRLSADADLKAVLKQADQTVGKVTGKMLKKNISDFEKALCC